MKRVKKILSMVLVVGLLMTLIPVQVSAASADAAEIGSYEAFLKNLIVLEGYAADYADLNPGKDPALLTIKYIRTGAESYQSGIWTAIAGQEDFGFAQYALDREAAHNAAAENADDKVNISGLKKLKPIVVPNGDKVDMGRVFGVMDASYHNSGSTLYADAAGWAWDLVDLMVLADSGKVSGTLEEMVAEITETYFLQDNAGVSFSQAECFGDLDGFGLGNQLTAGEYESGMISKLVKDYYSADLTNEERVDYFLKNRMDAVTARGDIRNAVFNGYTGNEMVASLESSQTFAASDLSDLRKACCYAFADYLCMLAGDYVEWNENIYYSLDSSEKVTLVPGITQEKLTSKTSDGKQMVYYLATADVSNPYVNVYVNYKNNNPASGWGMQSVRDQAHAAEARHSNPANADLYIPNYDVVVAVNGAGYNMTTGEPAGLMMMEGVEHHAPDGQDHGGYGFFGILKDGSAVIGSTAEYYKLKEQNLIMEGIDNFGSTLVKDGKLAVAHADTHTSTRASRTAVGITKTGKVVFMVLDGRQEPISCGGSMQEIAQIMLDAGCVDAINLDGGGSTTFLAQQSGESDISLVNNPSDGFERSVSASLIMVSTLPSPTSFDHAELDSAVRYLTVGSQVQIEATGINAAGGHVEIPKGAVWTVSDETVASISADGVLTGLKNGQVEVSLTLGGKTVGSRTMSVVVPDAVYFEKANMGVIRGETVTLPVAALYEGKRVAIQKSDLTMTLSSEAGVINGFTFTAGTDAGIKNVVVTAAAVQNPAASGSMTITLYNSGEASFDFAQATGGNRQLAWLREVSNAASDDNLTYAVVDTTKPMTTGYTLAFDAAQLPIGAKLRELVLAQLGIAAEQNAAFLLQLADKVSADSSVTLQITFDSNLTVDTGSIALTSELFTLESAKLDSDRNVLSLVLNWKAQNAPLSSQNTNTVCILTGIAAAPKQEAAWDARKRLSLVNDMALDYSILVHSDALNAYAQANPGQGIKAYDGEAKGGLLAGSYSAGKDSYTLANSLKNGWLYEEGGYAYYVDGVRSTGVRKVGEYYYDFGETGINIGQTRYSGLFMENNVRHYAKAGVLASGWYIEGDAHYCFDENGTGYNGTIIMDGVDMRFDNGLHVGGYTGFKNNEDGSIFYYTNGLQDYGWVYVGEDLYHFHPESGIMTTGTKVIPDEEAAAKGAYYDFAEDGRTLRGYFNGFGYYYWAGEPKRDSWVKEGSDPDPDAWYHTNGNGHYVTTPNANETFQLELDGVTYTAVKIAYDNVEYTFDNSNGKLLKGSKVYEGGNWYYYWAGQPVNEGWFELDGNTYYAYDDGRLAMGSHTIENQTYMFTRQGALVEEGTMMTAALSENCETMEIRIVNAADAPAMRVAVWAVNAGQNETLIWVDMEKTGEGEWKTTVPLCQFALESADTYELHAYTVGDSLALLVDTMVFVPKGADHVYSDDTDATCNNCGAEREVTLPCHVYDNNVDGTCNICGVNRETVEERVVVHMFRMYNPNTGEHFYTGSEVEKENLIGHGWQYEGVGFTFPANTGDPVHRLFQPSTGEHLYTMDNAEKDALMANGWNYEGIAFNSAYDTEAVQHRLHNPNATVGAYHFTFSEEEMQNLIDAGWEYQGIGWYSCWK